MTIDLDKLEALAHAATPGPWRDGTIEKQHVFVRCAESLGPERVLLRMNTYFPHADDSAYIAAASPDVVLALLARVRELERSSIAAYKAWREDNACKSCFAMPDEDGERYHGRGCYVVDERGGGSDCVSTEGV